MSAATATSYRIGNEELPVFDNRVAFAETLIELARKDARIVAVVNDSVGSSNLGKFKELFPDRLINVGIAEQNMVGVGAGLANAGLIPFVCAAGPFLTGRATEQVKADIAYSNAKVILCGMSPGMAYGELGPTHHSVEDFSWMRALPNLDILVPADEPQMVAAVQQLAANPRPTYLRVGRHKVPNLTPSEHGFGRGKWQQLATGTDATIIATGSMVSRAMAAAALLESSGRSIRVLNASSIAPLDEQALLAAALETGAVVTVEEANVAGGLGAAVASTLVQAPAAARVPVRILGVTDWAPTYSTEGLWDYFGLNADGIVAAVEEALKRD